MRRRESLKLNAELNIINNSGHSMTEDGIAAALVRATDHFGS